MVQLKKFPDNPVFTREEAHGSRPHPEEPRFRLVARDEGSFPCFIEKGFPPFAPHLKRRRSRQERRGELQGRATIPRVPQMSQSIPEEPVFLALPRFSRGGSTHTMVARGTALLESLVGKPQILCSLRREASHCCNLWEGNHTCMPPLETRTDSPGETAEIPQDPLQHWRGILRFRHRFHTKS